MRSSYNLDTIQKGDGPREKLLASGPDMLSDSELLAILFVTGTRNENVLELSGRVLREYGSRSIANIKDPNQVIEVLGLGPAKACQLVALFELGRRYYLEQTGRMPTIKGPEDIVSLCREMKAARKEELRAFYLNSRQKVIREELLSMGGENMLIVKPKEILHPAVDMMAQGIIIIHNHPSGEISPSDEDVQFTYQLREACEIMGIKLVDHIVIAKKGYTSLCSEGYI